MRKQGNEGKDQKQQCLGSAAEKAVWGVPHTCFHAEHRGHCTQFWSPHPFLVEARGPGRWGAWAGPWSPSFLLSKTRIQRSREQNRKPRSYPNGLHFLQRCKSNSMKDSVFNKWCQSNWIFIRKKRNFDLNLTSNTKINLMRITGFGVKYETIKLLEENIRKKSSGPKPWAIALRQVTKSRSHKK